MPSRMMQPYEHEEFPLWPFGDWPLSRGFLPALRSVASTSDLSVWEEKDDIVVEAGLPGIKAGEVDLSFERGVLTIRADRKEEKEDKERKYFQKSSSSFVYRLSIPGEFDESVEPKANLSNGVLQIRFKKQKRSVPKKINVQES